MRTTSVSNVKTESDPSGNNEKNVVDQEVKKN